MLPYTGIIFIHYKLLLYSRCSASSSDSADCEYCRAGGVDTHSYHRVSWQSLVAIHHEKIAAFEGIIFMNYLVFR